MLMCVTTRDGLAIRHYWNSYENAPPTLQSSNPTENHQVQFYVHVEAGFCIKFGLSFSGNNKVWTYLRQYDIEIYYVREEPCTNTEV